MVNHGNNFGWLVVTVVRMLSCSLGSCARSKDSRLDVLVTRMGLSDEHISRHTTCMHAPWPHPAPAGVCLCRLVNQQG